MPLEIYPVDLSAPSRAPINHSTIAATLHGLEGSYTSRDIYARYLSICEETRQPPVSAERLGRHLASLGHEPWRNATTRGWHISPAS